MCVTFHYPGATGGAAGLLSKGNVVMAELHGLREAMHKDNETTQRQLTGMRDENRCAKLWYQIQTLLLFA